MIDPPPRSAPGRRVGCRCRCAQCPACGRRSWSTVTGPREVCWFICPGGPEDILALLEQSWRHLLAVATRHPAMVRTVAIGVPGPVGHSTGTPVRPPLMPGWDAFPVGRQLGERFGCHVLVSDDARTRIAVCMAASVRTATSRPAGVERAPTDSRLVLTSGPVSVRVRLTLVQSPLLAAGTCSPPGGLMTDSALLALQRSIEELKTAVSVLSHIHGKPPVVARLCNDLERLQLDAADAEVLRTPDLPAKIKGQNPNVYELSDEPYDPTMWADSDQEGVGGYGHNR